MEVALPRFFFLGKRGNSRLDCESLDRKKFCQDRDNLKGELGSNVGLLIIKILLLEALCMK